MTSVAAVAVEVVVAAEAVAAASEAAASEDSDLGVSSLSINHWLRLKCSRLA